MTQFADHISVRLVLQLISSISRVLPIFLMYFNGTAISTCTVTLAVLFVNLDLNLNDLESVIICFIYTTLSLKYCHKLPMFLNNYGYILLNYTMNLQHQDLWHYLLLCYLFHLFSWFTVDSFKYYLLIDSICYYCSLSNNCYSSFNNYVCITVIT